MVIDDSHGLPFASGTSVALQGNVGSGGTLSLGGSGVVNGDERYVDADFNGDESLSLGGVNFSLNKAVIGQVYDAIQIGGIYDVETSSQSVQVATYVGSAQCLSNLSGSFLTYANKATIMLNEYAPNAGILLTASVAAPLEGIFFVEMHGAGDVTTIGGTPSNVVTLVFTSLGPVANNASVDVWDNQGPVIINGNASTSVSIGYPYVGAGYTSLGGITANVSVSNVGSLSMNDKGESPTSVTVTENSISGVGLFGNNSVKLSYFNVGTLNLEADGAFEKYTVQASQPGAAFSSAINITDAGWGTFRADVFVDSGSHLNLSLVKLQLPVLFGQGEAELFIHPGNGTVHLPGRLPRKPWFGTAEIDFAGGFTSLVSVQNFDGVAVLP